MAFLLGIFVLYQMEFMAGVLASVRLVHLAAVSSQHLRQQHPSQHFSFTRNSTRSRFPYVARPPGGLFESFCAFELKAHIITLLVPFLLELVEALLYPLDTPQHYFICLFEFQKEDFGVGTGLGTIL
jgi:hypothetical protein